MRTIRVGVVVAAAVFAQGCFPLALFPLVVVPGLTSQPEVCESCRADLVEADRLADGVPYWMEQSRVQAGPTARADRTGYYSWEISLDGQPISKCGARTRGGWQCDSLVGTPGLAPL